MPSLTPALLDVWQAYVKANGRRSRRNPPKAESKKRASSTRSSPASSGSKKQDGPSASSQSATGAKGSKPADSAFIEAAVNVVRQAQHASEQEGGRARPMVPLPVESEIEEEDETRAPVEGWAEEDSGPEATSEGGAPVDDSLEKVSAQPSSMPRPVDTSLQLLELSVDLMRFLQCA